jgi:hypothetical protein
LNGADNPSPNPQGCTGETNSSGVDGGGGGGGYDPIYTTSYSSCPLSATDATYPSDTYCLQGGGGSGWDNPLQLLLLDGAGGGGGGGASYVVPWIGVSTTSASLVTGFIESIPTTLDGHSW